MNSLRHDYKNWKSRFGIPDNWDWWFNPAISWKNKYERGWFCRYVVPFSDLWHSVWTLWQIGFVTYAITAHGWLSGLIITGVSGVFLIFNGIYAFMRRRKFNII